ncbi:LADA_0D04170g1_1 [Lachancea dasiensis]|uniref:Protein transport protein sec16 n=1 Tax=Lachancea dasiensis TaxID=1072105 RepID=A0A1G4J5N3_9SACH|nr:LADA_0D04170g1_1 [Lachancea dasiensis]
MGPEAKKRKNQKKKQKLKLKKASNKDENTVEASEEVPHVDAPPAADLSESPKSATMGGSDLDPVIKDDSHEEQSKNDPSSQSGAEESSSSLSVDDIRKPSERELASPYVVEAKVTSGNSAPGELGNTGMSIESSPIEQGIREQNFGAGTEVLGDVEGSAEVAEPTGLDALTTQSREAQEGEMNNNATNSPSRSDATVEPESEHIVESIEGVGAKDDQEDFDKTRHDTSQEHAATPALEPVYNVERNSSKQKPSGSNDRGQAFIQGPTPETETDERVLESVLPSREPVSPPQHFVVNVPPEARTGDFGEASNSALIGEQPVKCIDTGGTEHINYSGVPAKYKSEDTSTDATENLVTNEALIENVNVVQSEGCTAFSNNDRGVHVSSKETHDDEIALNAENKSYVRPVEGHVEHSAEDTSENFNEHAEDYSGQFPHVPAVPVPPFQAKGTSFSQGDNQKPLPWEEDQQDQEPLPWESQFSQGDNQEPLPWEKDQQDQEPLPWESQFSQGDDQEPLPWEKDQEDQEPLPWESQTQAFGPELLPINSEPYSNDLPYPSDQGEHRPSPKEDQAVDELFDNNDEEEALPWNVPDDRLSSPQQDSHISYPGVESQRTSDSDYNHDTVQPELNLTAAQDGSAPTSKSTGTHQDEADLSVIQTSMEAHEMPKKFSFLDNDDDLLEDDDSFLDSDDDFLAEPAEKVSSHSPSMTGSNSTVDMSVLPRAGGTKVYTPATLEPRPAPVIAQAQSQLTTPAPPQAPLNVKSTRYAPPVIDGTAAQSAFVSPIATANSALPTNILHRQELTSSNVPAPNVYKKLDEEKKKSDAYDLPLELAPRQLKKAKQPKPFGASSPALSATSSSNTISPLAGIAPIRKSSDGLRAQAPRGLVANSVNQSTSSVVAPVNPYGPPAASAPPKVSNSYVPTTATNETVSMPSKRYAPQAHGEPTANLGAVYQSSSKTMRSRALSNISNGSVGSVGSSNSFANAPPMDYNSILDSRAPIVPALKTVGLPKIGAPALSPNTQRRSHARSNSSVYAPAYSSKYAPTVQPQYQLSPLDDGEPAATNNSILRPPTTHATKPRASKAPGRSPIIEEQPIDPNIAFQRQFPIFNWGKSSKLVYAASIAVTGGNYFSSADLGPDIRVSSYDSVVKASGYLKAFPGPLVKGKSKVREVQDWIDGACEFFSKEQPLKDLTLYQILKVKLTVGSGPQEIAKVLYNSDELLPFLSQPSTRKKTAYNAQKLCENDQLRVLAALQTGRQELALELALSERDFSMALIISSLLGKERWTQVVDAYLGQEFRLSDATDHSVNLLALIFQVSVGNSKRAIDELGTDPVKGNWALNNWKVIIAGVLNNVIHHTNDSESSPSEFPHQAMVFLVEFGIFLSQKDMFLAGICCFVIADIPLSYHEVIQKSEVRFSSVGSENSLEGVLLSEIYEFYHSVRDPKFARFDHLLLQKLMHSSILFESGMATEALKYTDFVALGLRSLPKNSSLCATVELRLNSVSSKLAGTSGSWLGKPKLSQVWGQLDKSFNKFIGGDSEETNADESGKIFENFTPSSSRNSSKIDLAQQPPHFNPSVSINNAVPPAFTPSLSRTQAQSTFSSFAGPVKVRESNGNMIPENRVDLPQTSWGGTSSYKVQPEVVPASFSSPNQPVYLNSPARTKDQSSIVMTPPPLFSSSSSKRYMSKRVGSSGEGVSSDSLLRIGDETTIPQSRGKRFAKDNQSLSTDMLAELHVAPPPAYGGAGSYSSRRNSTQSRSSYQSRASNFSSPKQSAIACNPPGSEFSEEAVRENESQARTGGYATNSELSQALLANDELEDHSSNDPAMQAWSAKHEEALPFDTQLENPRTDRVMRSQSSKIQGQSEDANETENQDLRESQINLQPPKIATTNEEIPAHEMEVSSASRSDTEPAKMHILPSTVSKNPYAPVPTDKKPKSTYNPYAPVAAQSDSVSMEQPSMQPLLQNNPSEELDFFAYGGYNVKEITPLEEDQGRVEIASDFDASHQNVQETLKDVENNDTNYTDQLFERDGYKSDSAPLLSSSKLSVEEPRFAPAAKLRTSSKAADGDEIFNTQAPVIRPSSNPNFKPFTPASTPGVEDYYEDIIENASEEDEEDAAEAARAEREAREKDAKEEARNKEKKAKGNQDKNQNNASWFGWLRKDPNEKKAVKAKLGHQNTFYYDEKLQRWVNKNATEEEKQQVSTPPPPPPIIKKKVESSPKVKPRSGSVAGGASARTTSSISPTTISMNKEIISPPIGTNDIPKSGTPSINPSVSLSSKKANGLDDLMSLVGNSSGQTTRKKKKGTRGYVNVMNNL